MDCSVTVPWIDPPTKIMKESGAAVPRWRSASGASTTLSGASQQWVVPMLDAFRQGLLDLAYAQVHCSCERIR